LQRDEGIWEGEWPEKSKDKTLGLAHRGAGKRGEQNGRFHERANNDGRRIEGLGSGRWVGRILIR